MVTGDVPLTRILEMYSEVKRENIIMLILRSMKLYEARLDVKRLLVFFVSKEEQLKEIE
jgi:hypothetical protein